MIQHNENSPSLPNKEIVDFIQANNGNILVSTWGGGIAVYDERLKFKRNIVFPGPYQNNMVWCFVQDDNGNIWAGCQHGYLHIYDPVKETFKTLRPPELANSTIRCMTKDINGNIWLGLHNGQIAKWDKNQNKFYTASDNSGKTNGSPVFKIFIDKSGNFWVSTGNGFKEFDPVKRMYARIFLPNERIPKAISGMSSQGIESYDDTTLLVGTIYGGLNFFNTKTKTFAHLTTNDGLPSNSVYALGKDADGHIWFTTDYNLYKSNPAGKKFVRYNLEEQELLIHFSPAIDFTHCKMEHG